MNGNTVGDVMTRDILILPLETSVREAALHMAREGLGTVLVGDEQSLVGILTDRDITIRFATQDKTPLQCCVEEIMSRDIKFVFDHDPVTEAVDMMAKFKVRRLAVLNDDKRLVGVLSLADLAARSVGAEDAGLAQEALRQVSVPDVKDPAPTGGVDASITVRPKLQETIMPESDAVDEAGKQSFPASDPMSHSQAGAKKPARDSARRKC